MFETPMNGMRKLLTTKVGYDDMMAAAKSKKGEVVILVYIPPPGFFFFLKGYFRRGNPASISLKRVNTKSLVRTMEEASSVRLLGKKLGQA